MVPLAVTGSIVIGVVVVGALLLLRILLRSDARLEDEEERERNPKRL